MNTTSGFLAGMFFGALLCAYASNSLDKDIEKSGVWTIKDRAYKITRIEPNQ